MQERDFVEVASAGKPPYLRQFEVRIGDNYYYVKVTYPRYLEGLKLRNAARPLSARVDENIFPFNDVNAVQFGKMTKEEVYLRLSQTPIDKLRTYLVEQSEDPVLPSL